MKVIVDAINQKESLGQLYGIFFEDINHAADGGLYGELIQNRSFEFDSIDRADYTHLTAWEKIEQEGKISLGIMTGGAVSEKNPHYLAIDIQEPGNNVGVQNIGFNTGIPFKEGETYYFTCYGKREQSLDEAINISFRSCAGKVYMTKQLYFTTAWQKFELEMTAPVTDYSGRLAIIVCGRGKVYLDLVSLFPKETFKGRRNGLRKDIAEKLADMHPKFMRFPGGCLVHDGALDALARDAQYRWKNSIGPLEDRSARRNNWNYNQTLGLGYFEYFQFCEDIGAEPLPVLPGGYDPHHKRYAPLEELTPFIEDAIDLIEFANGDTTTVWGAKRAELGHALPFNLKYIGIGNEEVGEEFFERYDIIHQTIREKYPEIKIINTGSPFAAGGEYERGWANARKNQSDLVDEHYYMAPEWFLANHHRYDDFSETDPKVFLGEYASWGNTWYNALVEASYMIGLERNAKSVALACYAPMLANVDYINWKPDMIWFDNHRVFGTANYYVQKMFMENQGDYRLESKIVDGLETVVIEAESEKISGRILLSGNESKIAYSDILFTDLMTGEQQHFGEVCSDENSCKIPLCSTQSSHYELELSAKEVEGWKGIQIYFGYKDEANTMSWSLGGWQNQDAFVGHKINGRNSDLSQYAFSVEKGRTYRLKLKVEGRKISTFVDGILYHQVESKPAVIESLYVSASKDCLRNETIIKVVNVLEQASTATLVLKGLDEGSHKVEIIQMAGYELEEENGFDELEKIVPQKWMEEISIPTFSYRFPGHSVTILRIKK